MLFSGDVIATTTLALFHTCFNVIGVLLMLPLAKPLVNWLKQRFVTLEEDDSKTLYLSKQSLSVQTLAMHALQKELRRLSQYTLTMANDCLNYEIPTKTFAQRLHAVKNRINQIGHYTTKLYQQNLTEQQTNVLPVMLRITRYYDAVAELAMLINNAQKDLADLPIDIQTQLSNYNQKCVSVIEQSELETSEKEEIDIPIELLEQEYQQLKALVLRRGTEGQLPIHKMEKTLVNISHIRRLIQQTDKAYQHFIELDFNEEETDENDENKEANDD
jgi:phosphate:Na+ symporter